MVKKNNTNTKNTNINTNNIDTNIPSVSFAEDFANKFINQYSKFLTAYANTNFYNPIYANNALKQFNTYSNRPTEEKLINWLNNPRYYEQQLRGCSDFLFYSCQYYERSVLYVSNILNFDYELVPINPPSPTDKKNIKLYDKQKDKNNEWLRKFRVKEQLSNIMLDVFRSGGKFYYLRESDEGYYLQQMPDNYCYINGRTDITGYTYAMDMSFFYQFPESIHGFSPEFYDWYEEFLSKKEKLNEKANPYRMMPVDNAVVFKFDDTRPESIPPFSGVFKDAVRIEDYQDLLKLRTELETFQIMYMEVPKDNDNKPTISAQEVINYVAMAQSMLPAGVAAISTPMSMSDIKFNQSASINNIVGLGASNYYKSSGITPALFGADTKSAIGIQNSIHTDYLMCEHMYDQFERFVNYKLSKIDGEFNFAIKFLRRSNFKIEEDKKSALSLLQNGGPVSRVLSSYGYEPWQQKSIMIDNKIGGLYDLLLPPKTAFTMSANDNKGGRPNSEDEGKQVSDSADNTKSGGYNEDKKFSLNNCLNCSVELDDYNIPGFCSEDCLREYYNNFSEDD